MLRKIAALLLCFVFAAQNIVFAQPLKTNPNSKGKLKPPVVDIMSSAAEIKQAGGFTEFPAGLQFHKSFGPGPSLNGDFAKGECVPTFTASRSATNPATYIDETGAIQRVTTSNTPRITRGYYDSTGFHLATGFLYEPAATNLLTYTDGTQYSATKWTGWDADQLTLEIQGTATYTVNLIPELTSIPNAKSQRIRYTGSASDSGTNELGWKGTTTAVGSVVQNDTITVSGYVKSTTGNSGVGVRFYIKARNAADSLLASWAGNDISASLGTTFKRFTLTAQMTDATCSRVRVAIEAYNVSTGDTVDIEFYGIQVEKNSFSSSFIPTTTAALTRNAESISYASANNFPAAYGDNCLMFDGSNDYVSVPNSATGNQFYGSTAYTVVAWVYCKSVSGNRIWNKTNAGLTTGIFLDVNTTNNARLYFLTSSGTKSIEFSSAFPLKQWVRVVGVWNGTTGIVYQNGIAGTPGSASGTATDESAETGYIGNRAAGDRPWNGYVRDLRIYRNIGWTQTDVTNDLAGQTIAGATAVYPMNEGTGNTITDTIAANNGTNSGAQWSKTVDQGTMVLKMRPIMLANEQPSSWQPFFTQNASSNNSWRFIYGTNAQNFITYTPRHNNVGSDINSSTTPFVRFTSYSLIGTWNTASGTVFYINGASVGTPLTYYYIPLGSLASTFSLGTVPMIVEAIQIYDRTLDANEAKVVNGLLNNL